MTKLKHLFTLVMVFIILGTISVGAATNKPPKKSSQKHISSKKQPQISGEEKAVRKAGITIKDVNVANKAKEYVPVVKFNSDSYEIKYLGEKFDKGTLLTGASGTKDMSVGDGYNAGDKAIRKYFSEKKGAYIQSENEKEKYLCMPFNMVNGVTYFAVEKNDNSKILSGKLLKCVFVIMEVGYDNSRKWFYIRNTKIKEFENGIIKVESRKEGSIEKYVAIPLLIVDPYGCYGKVKD